MKLQIIISNQSLEKYHCNIIIKPQIKYMIINCLYIDVSNNKLISLNFNM